MLRRARAAGSCGSGYPSKLREMLSPLQGKRAVTAQKTFTQSDKMQSSRPTERRSGAAGFHSRDTGHQVSQRYHTVQMSGWQAISGRSAGLL